MAPQPGARTPCLPALGCAPSTRLRSLYLALTPLPPAPGKLLAHPLSFLGKIIHPRRFTSGEGALHPLRLRPTDHRPPPGWLPTPAEQPRSPRPETYLAVLSGTASWPRTSSRVMVCAVGEQRVIHKRQVRSAETPAQPTSRLARTSSDCAEPGRRGLL